MATSLTQIKLSSNPTEAWAQMKPNATVMRFKTRSNPKNSVAKNKARIVAISDTHSLTSHIKRKIPDGDILIHAGDFTRCGHISEVQQFNKWLGTLPHKHKIVIAGNHELTFDKTFCNKGEIDIVKSLDHRTAHTGDSIRNYTSSDASLDKVQLIPTLGMDRKMLEEAVDDVLCPEQVKKELTNCTYLEDCATNIYGVKIYGTPWQPKFCGWAFNLERGQQLMEKWDLIPDDTDVLITHTPPLGYGDLCATGDRAGCVDLLMSVQHRIRPKYHIYGHIHEGYGVRSDGKTVFVNASLCDIAYNPTNRPIVFDIQIPDGYDKG